MVRVGIQKKASIILWHHEERADEWLAVYEIWPFIYLQTSFRYPFLPTFIVESDTIL